MTHDELPRKAEWWIALKPLLLHVATSALCSSKILIKSSRLFDIASCNGVSPSESCIPEWAPFDKRVLHTLKWPLQTPEIHMIYDKNFLYSTHDFMNILIFDREKMFDLIYF